MSKTIRELACADIIAGDNDRTAFDETALAELATSIADQGLLQPITVRPVAVCNCGVHALLGDEAPPDCDRCGLTRRMYQIVAGERRFRAVAFFLHWPTISAIVREMDDMAADAAMLAENLQRRELLPLDEAQAYQKRMEKYGWSVPECARQAKVSDTRVRSRLKLLSLVPEAQQLINTDQLPLAFGETLAAIPPSFQRTALKWLVTQARRPSAGAFSRYVAEMMEEAAKCSFMSMVNLMGDASLDGVLAAADGRLWEVLPRVPGLPELPIRLGGMARVIDAYIVALLTQGHLDAARVMIDFWAKAQQANYSMMPALDSQTLKLLVGNNTIRPA